MDSDNDADAQSDSRKSEASSSNSGLAQDLKKQKKNLKVVKEAYKKELEKNKALEKELELVKARVGELESECREKENKYLDLYHENT
jgi:peptidoglycan hydrolase CwlO-like protein